MVDFSSIDTLLF